MPFIRMNLFDPRNPFNLRVYLIAIALLILLALGAITLTRWVLRI